MEYLADIQAFINSVGFPIVATIVMGYLLVKENTMHKEEMNALKESINSNTLVMTELKQLLIDMRDMNNNENS